VPPSYHTCAALSSGFFPAPSLFREVRVICPDGVDQAFADVESNHIYRVSYGGDLELLR